MFQDLPMNYDLILTNTVLTRLAEFTLWMIRLGGAIHVGTNQKRTSLLVKIFGLSPQPEYFWINSEEDVDKVLNTIYDAIEARTGPKRMKGIPTVSEDRTGYVQSSMPL